MTDISDAREIAPASSVHEFTVTDAAGKTHVLDEFAGQMLLVVNVASKCGLTPQYEGLEALHRELNGRGLAVLGFPCNQFAGQEPGTDAEIQDFCSTQFDVTFPVFAKIDVNGDSADPLFVHLRAEAPGDFGPNSGPLYEHIAKSRPEAIGTDEVKWNFTKFLVDRDGSVVKRYEPTVTPEEIKADVEPLLG